LRVYVKTAKTGVKKMDDKTAIHVKNLNYKIENHVILQNINFEIHTGDFVGIIGPNGAGKSTLIKVILNEIKDYTGEIKISGKIGYVPQHDEIDRSFPITVKEVALMGMYKEVGIFRHYTAEHVGKVMEVLKVLGIDHLKNRKAGKLSGGEYQRLLLARALVSKPDILILDEPEAGVDKNGQILFYGLLKKLNQQEKVTVILVSHDLSMVFKETTKVMCLNRTLHCHKNTTEMSSQDLKDIYAESLEMLVHIDNPLKVVSRND
jgi:zinc transport system ATP-binding protein